jgi:hypothetical protein
MDDLYSPTPAAPAPGAAYPGHGASAASPVVVVPQPQLLAFAGMARGGVFSGMPGAAAGMMGGGAPTQGAAPSAAAAAAGSGPRALNGGMAKSSARADPFKDLLG